MILMHHPVFQQRFENELLLKLGPGWQVPLTEN